MRLLCFDPKEAKCVSGPRSGSVTCVSEQGVANRALRNNRKMNEYKRGRGVMREFE